MTINTKSIIKIILFALSPICAGENPDMLKTRTTVKSANLTEIEGTIIIYELSAKISTIFYKENGDFMIKQIYSNLEGGLLQTLIFSIDYISGAKEQIADLEQSTKKSLLDISNWNLTLDDDTGAVTKINVARHNGDPGQALGGMNGEPLIDSDRNEQQNNFGSIMILMNLTEDSGPNENLNEWLLEGLFHNGYIYKEHGSINDRGLKVINDRVLKVIRGGDYSSDERQKAIKAMCEAISENSSYEAKLKEVIDRIRRTHYQMESSYFRQHFTVKELRQLASTLSLDKNFFSASHATPSDQQAAASQLAESLISLVSAHQDKQKQVDQLLECLPGHEQFNALLKINLNKEY